MGHLAQAQLLRALMRGAALGAGLTLIGAAAFAAGEEEAPPATYAPGATGAIRAPVDQIVRDAERRAPELGARLTIQPPQAGVEIEDLDGIRRRALEDPRVRALLGTDEGPASEAEEKKYEDAAAVVFLSFSMPDASIRQALRDAKDLGVMAVFRGFHGASVYETRARLDEIFADEETIEGFAIDPTLFRRFKVQAVPVVAVLAGELGECLTPACEGDEPPVHDRLSGNVPLRTALKIIAAGQGDAKAVAAGLLEDAE